MSEKSSFICENLSFAGKEAYKRLRANIQFSFVDDSNCHVIGVSSAQPGDGKSLTSINIAYSFAELGKRVLLIDGDMRRPSLHRKLGFPQVPGLSNVLANVNLDGNTVHTYGKERGTSTFDCLLSGEIAPNPNELLNSDKMKLLMNKLRENYDYIVFDLPPVDAVADAQVVSTIVDGMILVIREGYCSRALMEDCLQQLEFANARVLGFVLNGSSSGASKYGKYKKYGKYGSYSNYGSAYYKSGYIEEENVPEKSKKKSKKK